MSLYSPAPVSKVKRSSQNGFVIWHGMTLSGLWRLLMAKPELHWSRWNRIAMLPGMACYNSLMAAAENLICGRAVQQTRLVGPPVFVLGFWRSGTTLLHGLLNRDPQFTSPTMYRTLFPWHFLLTEKIVSRATGWLMPRSRPMDNVPMSWDAPQEDDIALCIMSLISPYSFLATPRNLQEFWKSLEMEKLSEPERQHWKDCLMLLLRKITYADQRRIVLKSPSHTYRIPLLLEMFPDAKFVYIYRNPYDVFRSAVHLRRTMIQENGLGRPVFRDVEQEIIRTYQACFEAYERDRHLIPAGNLHEMRFEDLEIDPAGEMANLYHGIGLPCFENLRTILQSEVPRLKRYRKNSFEHDPYWSAEVSTELQPAFERFGYPLEETQQQTVGTAA